MLLLKRNQNWLPRILELLKGDRNAMVIVGTGHLVGKGSVVNLLVKRGYSVKQMSYDPGTERPPAKEKEAEAATSPQG